MAKRSSPQRSNKAATGVKSAAKKPNLFKKAATISAASQAAAKPKGTTIDLPRDLDAEGSLRGESKVLNEAVAAFIKAKSEVSAAKTRADQASGKLLPWVKARWAELYAGLGSKPATPVSVANHQGESVTFVLVDKSQQYKLSDESLLLLTELVGADAAEQMCERQVDFGFSSKKMRLPLMIKGKPVLGEDGVVRTVGDAVMEAVSDALYACEELDSEALDGLVDAKVVTRVKPNTMDRVAEIVGADCGKIAAVFDAFGSSASRYLKS